METNNTTIIIIDDSILDIFILKKFIALKYPYVKTIAFENVLSAVDFAKNLETTLIKEPQHFIVFLDLHIPPEWTWNFLEIYEHFSPELKQHLDIYLTSSSLDTELIKNVMDKYKIIKDFILKPFHKDNLPMFTTTVGRA